MVGQWGTRRAMPMGKRGSDAQIRGRREAERQIKERIRTDDCVVIARSRPGLICFFLEANHMTRIQKFP